MRNEEIGFSNDRRRQMRSSGYYSAGMNFGRSNESIFYVHVGALSNLKLCRDGACVVWVCEGDNSGESL